MKIIQNIKIPEAELIQFLSNIYANIITGKKILSEIVFKKKLSFRNEENLKEIESVITYFT
jgi:hypothetical protein